MMHLLTNTGLGVDILLALIIALMIIGADITDRR